MFTVQELRLESMTAAWLLPVVPAVVAAGTGAVVASTLPRQHALETLLVSYALLGIGLALSFMIMALYFHRLVVHHLPNAEVTLDSHTLRLKPYITDPNITNDTRPCFSYPLLRHPYLLLCSQLSRIIDLATYQRQNKHAQRCCHSHGWDRYTAPSNTVPQLGTTE